MLVLKNFIYEEDGLETIEIAIILAALIALAIVFKEQLAKLWGNVAGQLTGSDAGISKFKDRNGNAIFSTK